jgi:uncharacterized protein
MKITDEFTVSVPVDRAVHAWCPADRVRRRDLQRRVRIKVGPVISEFAGTGRFAEKDDAAHRPVIDARGKDSRRAGNALALIIAGLRPEGDRTVVSVDTDLKITGKVAQFGSGMIQQVSQKQLGLSVVAVIIYLLVR